MSEHHFATKSREVIETQQSSTQPSGSRGRRVEIVRAKPMRVSVSERLSTCTDACVSCPPSDDQACFARSETSLVNDLRADPPSIDVQGYFAPDETMTGTPSAVEEGACADEKDQTCPNEAGVIEEGTLSEAIDACVQFPASAFFHKRRLARSELLHSPYALACKLAEGGDEAIDAAIDALPVGLRRRRPSRHKFDLIAVELAAKPENTEQRKTCSVYATILRAAREKNIPVDDFPSWCSDANVEECRTAVKKIGSGRVKAEQNVEVEADGPNPVALPSSTQAADPQVVQQSSDREVMEAHVGRHALGSSEAWVEIACGIGVQNSAVRRMGIPLSLQTEIAGLLDEGLRRDDLPTFLRLIADAVEDGAPSTGEDTA